MRSSRLRSPNVEEIEEPLLNLTPLIDVVFVVLITFLLISPVLDIDLVQLAPSGVRAIQREGANTALTISIRSDGSIWFQGKQTSLMELEKNLPKAKKSHPTQTPQLLPDEKAPFGLYQSVKNILEKVGFEQMDVVLHPS